MSNFLRSRTGIIVIAVVLVLVLGLTAFFVVNRGGTSTDAAKESATEVPDGMVSIDDAAPLPPADQARPATERPTELPAQVFLSEKCAAAAAPLRQLMTDQPSGLALDEAGNTTLNTGLESMRGSCTDEEIAGFQGQELAPWMNYAVPAQN